MTAVDDLAELVAAADAVVSMAGYNTVCEILGSGRPAVVVPRVELIREQLMRAEAMRRRGLLRMIHPDDLTPARLLREVIDLLEQPPRAGCPLNMGGASAFVEELAALAGDR